MNSANLLSYLGTVGTTIISAGIGAFLATVGKNLAMRKYIGELTEKVESIKAAISGDLWDKQKQSEMKREVVLEAMRALGELDCALVDLQSIYLSQIPKSDELKQDRSNKIKDSRMRLYACETKFNGMRFLTDVVVGEGLSNALDEFDKEIRSIAKKINAGDNAYFRKIEVLSSLVNKRDAVTFAARKELKLGNAA